MNEHYVRFIFDEAQPKEFIRTFAGAMASTVNESLLESENYVFFEQYETSEGHYVYEVALQYDLDNATADAMVDKVSKKIPGDFTIEVSGPGHSVH